MLNMMISISICSSLMFIFMNHPLSMGAILLIQTISISLISGCFNSNFWFSYILTLIMVGGMLILFMYMTSVASNEKFKPSTKMSLNTLIIFMLSMILISMTEKKINNNEMTEMMCMKNWMTSLYKFITLPLSMVLLFMMIYLLITMVASTKITSFKQGSIRQMK